MHYSRRLNLIFWFTVLIIFCYNDFLGLFVPKILLRFLYIVLLVLSWCCLFLVFKNNRQIKLKKDFDKNSVILIIYCYLFLCCIRFGIQICNQNLTSASYISFLQTIIPFFAFFVALKLNHDDYVVLVKFYCFFSALSILLGFVDSKIGFLPKTGGFNEIVYAYAGDTKVVRCYSLAGNSLSTAYMASIAVCFEVDYLCNHWRTHDFFLLFDLFLLGINLQAVIFSYTRGAFVAVGVFLIFYFALLLLNKRDLLKFTHKWSFWLIGIIVIVVLFFCFKDLIYQSSFFQRFFVSGFSFDEPSNKGRIKRFLDAIAIIKFNPYFGLGFGFSGYQAVNHSVPNCIIPESYLLQLCLNTGIFSAVLFVAIVFNVLVNNKHKRVYKLIVLGLFCWSVVYILFESDLNAILLFFIIGGSFTDESNNHGVDFVKLNN